MTNCANRNYVCSGKQYRMLANVFGNQGLEGYSRDPGFDPNMVRDSGKRKISGWDSGFDCSPGSRICQNLGLGCRNFLPVCLL